MDDAQSDVWDQVEHDDAYLVKADPGDIHDVKDIDGHMNPMAHEIVHPIMSEREDQNHSMYTAILMTAHHPSALRAVSAVMGTPPIRIRPVLRPSKYYNQECGGVQEKGFRTWSDVFNIL